MAFDDYPDYYDAVMEAHAAGTAVLQRANLSVEPAHIALTVEDYRWAWRPEQVRVLLSAESHVYTTSADAEIAVRPVPLPADVAAISPSSFVRLVYCLGYGESQLLSPEPLSNSGTIQYWDIFGRLAGTGTQPRKAASPLAMRLAWKVATLQALRDRGVWLLDASVHGIGGRGREVEFPGWAKVKRELHHTWWLHYGRDIVAAVRADDPSVQVWLVGGGVRDAFNALRLPFDGWVYQPQAEQGGAKIDMERGWSDLLAAIS